jgi:hypothetical protein
MALTQVDQGMLGTNAQYTGFKNRIINGAMVIDQRNAGASVTASTTGSFVYTLDRWSYYASAASKFTIQQNAGSVTPPAGFTNYLGITSSSAYSITSSDIFFIQQLIEGFNVADLDFGKSTAKTITLSFWVRSSLTGTFGGSLLNSAQNRTYPFTYTISSANTWEQKSITVAGDTSGTWLTNNAIGLYVMLGLGVGSTYSGTAGAWSGSTYYSATGATSVVGTNGATFYITGVQLEKGSTATSFDYRPYGTELQLCQRYYETNVGIGTSVGNNKTTADRQYMIAFSSNSVGFNVTYIVPKRASPTLTAYSGSNLSTTNNQLTYYTGSAWSQATTTILSGVSASLTTAFQFDSGKTSAFTSGTSYICQPVWSADAEL